MPQEAQAETSALTRIDSLKPNSQQWHEAPGVQRPLPSMHADDEDTR